ncbi:MAG: hypothetical protein LBN42_00015 [Oscillospiraceae bacterium]|jgi:CobQ-like glutamine amidotransferase family enzyme|nr:hypothetical protein [Oscillospiraceae bacterium]
MKIIEFLYPDLCTLFGDPYNAEYLSKMLPEFKLVRTLSTDRPLFADNKAAIVYMGSMTEAAQECAISALSEYKSDFIRELDNNTTFLITGNALEVFGERIQDGEKTISGLGVFPNTARRQMLKRHNSFYLGNFNKMGIVGYKSQFAHTTGTDSNLFDTVRGVGLDGISGSGEGFRLNNFFATYLIGPLLIQNPPFAKYIASTVGEKDITLPFETAAYESYNARLKEYADKNKNYLL